MLITISSHWVGIKSKYLSTVLLLTYLQVTFSEKGTKITPQVHIQNFKILEISLWNQFLSAISALDGHGTLF